MPPDNSSDQANAHCLSAISAAEARRMVEAGGAGSVIDVRAGAEFDAEHIPGCRLIPLDELEARADEVRALPSPRLLLCRTGNRALMASRTLGKLRVTGLAVVEGGLDAYLAAGGATVKGRACISLERQVRIAAGSLVATGVALGFLVHPACFALSGFVGAGLVFAGITDWCGLGLLLCRMPWNRSKSCEAAPPKCACESLRDGQSSSASARRRRRMRMNIRTASKTSTA